jgi:formate dehydrogenase major subunit
LLTILITELGRTMETIDSVCTYCGVGCDIAANVEDNKIVKIFAHPDGVLDKNPAIKEAVASTLVDLDETWYETDLDAATTACAMKMKETQKNYGRKSICSIGGARSSCESAYLFQKFTRHTLNSPHVDNCARVCHSPSLSGMKVTIGEGAATNPYSDIYNAEFMIVIGSNTTEAHPIIANRIIDVAREHDNLAVFDG